MRVMTLDTHKDLVRAWRAINAAPEPRKERALAALQNLDIVGVAYDQAKNEIKRALNSKNKVDEITLARELGERFRNRYAEAERIARGED
jgi:hypothetical protein